MLPLLPRLMSLRTRHLANRQLNGERPLSRLVSDATSDRFRLAVEDPTFLHHRSWNRTSSTISRL